MKSNLRAFWLAIPLAFGACVVAVQSQGSAGAATSVLPINAPAKVGYSPGATAPAMRVWTECITAANAARWARGVAPLQMDMRITMAAAGHSAYQAQVQKMVHPGSGGSNAGDRLTAAGYTWSTWGENIAAGQGDCESVVSAWMNSAPHRANILNSTFRHIGIGMAIGANGVRYWTMDLAAGG